MSNISQQVLYQAFNQGLGTRSNDYLTPINIINYPKQKFQPMTFYAFTPSQKQMIKNQNFVQTSNLKSETNDTIITSIPKNMIGVL